MSPLSAALQMIHVPTILASRILDNDVLMFSLVPRAVFYPFIHIFIAG